MNTFIIDDEAPARRELRYLLEQIGDVTVVGEAPNGRLGLKGIRETKPNLIFLDIEMPGINGLQLSEFLRELPDKPLLIFATAFPQYATKAFDLEAFDYILKPITLERLKKTLQKVEKFIKANSGYAKKGTMDISKKIPLYKDAKIFPTSPEKIVFAGCENGEIFIKTCYGKYRVKSTLTELEQRLFPHGFIRPHRSSLINTNRVSEIIPWFNGSYKLVMDDKERTEIMVSRYNAKELKKYFDL